MTAAVDKLPDEPLLFRFRTALSAWTRRIKDASTNGEAREETEVFTRTRADYGENFDADVLEQYKLFVETEERLVSRRQEENRFFLSVTALLVTVIGILIKLNISDRKAGAGILLLSLAGMVLCYAWRSIIDSYRVLNEAKFVIIATFEAQLPARMFGAEWDAAQSRDYKAFTGIERIVPLVFGGLFVVASIAGILSVAGALHSG
jgi:hypothetical protein